MRPANEGEPAMRGSGENRWASFSCPCLLAPLPFPSPSPFFVSSSVSSYRRLVSRLVLLVEGRGVVVLVVSLLRRHRPCPRCPRIARASRPACRVVRRGADGAACFDLPWSASCPRGGLTGRCRSRLVPRPVLACRRAGRRLCRCCGLTYLYI